MVPMNAISRPLRFQSPMVSFALIAPVVKRVSKQAPREIKMLFFTEKKRNGTSGMMDPIKDEKPTRRAMPKGLLYSFGESLSSSVMSVESHCFLLAVIFLTIRLSALPRKPFL